MANKYFYQFYNTYEQIPVGSYDNFTIGAAGAVSAVKGMGITAVTKNGTAGNYTITYTDSFPRVLYVNAKAFFTTATGVANIDVLANPATFQAGFTSTQQITIQLYDYAGVAVNAASGTQIQLETIFRNSTVGPAD